MRSNGKALLLAGLALGGCSSGWWRDPPAAAPDPVAGEVPPSDPRTAAADADLAPPASAFAEPSPAGAPYAQRDDRPAVPSPPPPLRPGYDAPPPLPRPGARYDAVGYAGWSNDAGTVAAAHRSLPPGSFAEVTALDTGKTILVPITATSTSPREIELSGAAARELGLGGGGTGGVRVRVANPNGGDLAALNAGRPAPARPDTPPVLLNALRRKLTGTVGLADRGSPPPERDADAPPRGYVPSVPARAARPAPRPAAPTASGSGYYVQVAALADAARARAVARQLGGSVASGGGFHRVRLGPYADQRAALAARDAAARRGYAGATIVRPDR